MNVYVAEFIGDVNILEGTVAPGGQAVELTDGGRAEPGGGRTLPDGPAALALRPEKIAIEQRGESSAPSANTLFGTVEDIAYLGDMSIYHVRLESGSLIRIAQTNRLRALEETITWEDPVRLSWDGSAMVVLEG